MVILMTKTSRTFGTGNDIIDSFGLGALLFANLALVAFGFGFLGAALWAGPLHQGMLIAGLCILGFGLLFFLPMTVWAFRKIGRRMRETEALKEEMAKGTCPTCGQSVAANVAHSESDAARTRKSST